MKTNTKSIVGLAVAMSMAFAGAAFAAPAGVTEKDGAFIAPDGKPLYTFANDTVPGQSTCTALCAAAWPHLHAAPGAADDGDWTVVPHGHGKIWAYKGKPVYTYARDTAGEPAKGVSAKWPLAVK